MPRGKQSGISYGQRTKQKGQSDLAQLISLKRYLKDRFHMNFKREWYVGFDKEYGYLCRISESVGRKELQRFKWKNPDLICCDKQYGVIIVELDGAIHDRKVEKTKARNELFRGGGIKLVVLNMLQKQKQEMNSLEEEASNLLSSTLQILKSAMKQL